MLLDQMMPNGERTGSPPANGAEGCGGFPAGAAVWHPAQSAALARYAPRATNAESALAACAGVGVGAAGAASAIARRDDKTIPAANASMTATPRAARASCSVQTTPPRPRPNCAIPLFIVNLTSV